MPSAVAPVVLVCFCLQHTRARHVRSLTLYREWVASPELLATAANRHGESVARLSRAQFLKYARCSFDIDTGISD